MGKVTLKCAFCQGRGKDPFELLSRLASCQVCGGRGRIVVFAPFKRCPCCEGTGVYPHSRLTCSVCGGKGVVNERR